MTVPTALELAALNPADPAETAAAVAASEAQNALIAAQENPYLRAEADAWLALIAIDPLNPPAQQILGA
jgi:hypothetical protein